MIRLIRPVLLCAISLLVAANIAGAQMTNATLLGKWKGESLCTVKPSACHDETVVYEITAVAGSKDRLVWNADKIVDGKPVNMGSLECTYQSRTVTCDIPGRGVWSFTLDGDLMTGTLKLSDGTLFRKVSAKRAK
jgi:hypothetical protein